MRIYVRRATPEDWLAVERLYRLSARSIPRCWNWREFLGQDRFLILEDGTGIRGALLAWSDDSSIAWARLGVLDDSLSVSTWFDLIWPVLHERLDAHSVQSLLWMDYQEWAGPLLKKHGFRKFAQVITLVKCDLSLPGATRCSAALRPATGRDVAAIVSVDHSAFTPSWWYDTNTIRHRIASALQFVVAVHNGTVVAYIDSDRDSLHGHINRVAVAPRWQGRGVGIMLLRDALTTLWRYNATKVTLNTQVNNMSAQRLYERFGFAPTGSKVTVWERKF